MQTSTLFILLLIISLLAIPGFLIAALVRKGQRMKMLKLVGVSALVVVVSFIAAVWTGSIEREQDKAAVEQGGFESVQEYRRITTLGYTTKEDWAVAVQELEERVARVPASDYEENIRLYKELRKLDPDNDRYKQKISYYENKRPTYTVIDENISDTPIKTQIEQHIVVSGVPTEAALEAKILKRYRAAAARRGFRYHNSTTGIYIYVYGTEEQARAGQGLWIGMIAKGPLDKAAPRVRIDEGRLAALSQAPEERFGLSEEKRKQVFREIAAAENRATRDARARVPDSQIMKQIDLEHEIRAKYKAKVAHQNGLTSDQLNKISFEGIKKGWISPSPSAPPRYSERQRSMLGPLRKCRLNCPISR